MEQGSFDSSPEHYKTLVQELEKTCGTIELPSEYAYFFKDNLLQLLIRLARYKFACRLIKPDDRVLEVGCGTGMGSIFLGQHCRSVKGIDIQEREIDAAKKINRRTNVDFSVGDFFSHPPQESYDIVLSVDVIEHMSEKDGIEFIRKTTRHLKRDGMLVLGTPSCYSYDYSSELSKAAHIKLYDQKALVRIIDRFYSRTVAFSMNDEIVHTGFPKLAWYYFVLGVLPKTD